MYICRSECYVLVVHISVIFDCISIDKTPKFIFLSICEYYLSLSLRQFLCGRHPFLGLCHQFGKCRGARTVGPLERPAGLQSGDCQEGGKRLIVRKNISVFCCFNVVIFIFLFLPHRNVPILLHFVLVNAHAYTHTHTHTAIGTCLLG